jgi:regulator of replication initiation timing
MSEDKPDLTAKVAELEKKLDTTLDVIGKLVKALDYMRGDDARFIFEMDLVKHSLCEAGYFETATSDVAQATSPQT